MREPGQNQRPLQEPRPKLVRAGICLAAALLVGSIIAATYHASRGVVESWFLERWTTELAELSPEAAPGVMADAATRGDWGLRLLVAAAAHENPAAAISAAQELPWVLQRWKQEPEVDHSPQLQLLARELQARSEQFTPDQWGALRPTIQILCDWPVSGRGAERETFLKNCEALARRVTAKDVPVWTSTTMIAARLASLNSKTAPPPAVENPQPNPVAVNKPPTIVTDGDTPAARATYNNNDSEPRTNAVDPSFDNNRRSPELMLQLLPTRPDGIRRLDQGPQRLDPAEPLSSPPPLNSTDVVNIPSADASSSERLENLTDWELIQRMHGPEFNPQWIEAELTRRGYRTHDLAIAKRAAHPSAEVRRKLAEDLPRMTGIDARLWLRQLAQDPDPAVRQTATAILRTARDLTIPAQWK